jgi:hypothetical protein
LREEVIDLIRAKGDAANLPAEERDVITYVRQLMRANRVDQAVFDRLKDQHNAQWMVELTEVANYFRVPLRHGQPVRSASAARRRQIAQLSWARPHPAGRCWAAIV